MAGETPEQAANEAVDPDRLLPGEPESSDDPEERRHWASVYTELLNFKWRAIENLTSAVVHMAEPARRELQDTDLPLLRREADRFDRRFRFWSGDGSTPP